MTLDDLSTWPTRLAAQWLLLLPNRRYLNAIVLCLVALSAEGFSSVAIPKRAMIPYQINNPQLQPPTRLFIVTEKGSSAGQAAEQDEENFFFIRKALPAEIGAASDILTECFFKENTNFFTFQWERLTTFLSLDASYPKPGERHAFFVACHANSGVVLGLAEIDDRPSKSKDATPRPYMYNVAVDPKWRRKGIARALVLECEKTALQQWNRPNVYLKVRDTGKAAIAMYKSLGYTERTSKIEKLNDKYQNLIVMSKSLSEEAETQDEG